MIAPSVKIHETCVLGRGFDSRYLAKDIAQWVEQIQLGWEGPFLGYETGHLPLLNFFGVQNAG